MKSVFELVKSFIEAKLQLDSRKKNLKKKAIQTGQGLLVNVVLPTVTKLVREMIVDLGKDPDYIPRPKPKEPSKDRPSFRFGNPSVPSWVRQSFKNPHKHPIMQSRLDVARSGLKHEAPPEMERPLQVAASTIAKVVAANQPVTVSDSNAIDSLRVALKNMEDELFPLKRVAKKSVKKKAAKKSSKKSPKKSANVVRNFNGSFRRVSEE